jgi:hypothetical protein
LLNSSFSEFLQTATLSRPGTVTFTNGYATTGSPSVSTIKVCRQPITGKDLQRLPEGDRTGDLISCWTDTEARLADTLTVGSESYRVLHCEFWANLGETYYKILGVRYGN